MRVVTGMKGSRKRMALLGLLLLAAAASGWAQGAPKPAKGDQNVGLVFNIDSVPFGLASYAGGFGLKFGKDPWAVRALLSFNMSSAILAATGGAVFEYHLGTDRISPYLGVDLSAGVVSLTVGTTSIIGIPLHAGAIVGVEVFPADFLSLFAEYELGADVQVALGPPVAANYLAKIGLGNNAQVGLVLWFSRMKSFSG